MPSSETWYWQGTLCDKRKDLGSGSNFQATASGVYYLRAYNNNTNCWSATCASVNVVIDPGPTVSATSNSPVTASGPLSLSASSVTGATYSWTGPNGFTSTEQNLIRNPTNTTMTGEYCVTASVNGCNSSPSCTKVTVNSNANNSISGIVNDIGINNQLKLIESQPLSNCTVLALILGTTNVAGSANTDLNGNFTISNLASGNYDILAVDQYSHTVKLLNIPSNTNTVIIKVPNTLLNQVEKLRYSLSHLTSIQPTSGIPLSIQGYNTTNHSNTVNGWETITENHNEILEAAGRLYLADSALTLFYENADILCNEISTDIDELLKTLVSTIIIFAKTESKFEEYGMPDFIIDLIKEIRDFLVEKIKKAVDSSTTLSQGDKYLIKSVIQAEIERIETDPSVVSLGFDILKPFIEYLAGKVILENGYVQKTQSSLDLAVGHASSLSYTGTFNTNFINTKALMNSAKADAENARIYSELNRDYSEIVSNNETALDISSKAAAAVGLVPLAAALNTLAKFSKLVSFGFLVKSLDIALAQFFDNKQKLPQSINSSFYRPSKQFGELGKFSSLTEFEIDLSTTIKTFDSIVTIFKSDIANANYSKAMQTLHIIISKNKMLDNKIKNSFIPINCTIDAGKQSMQNFDSVYYSNFQYTLSYYPRICQRFYYQNLSLIADSTNLSYVDELLNYSDSLMLYASKIKTEFSTFYDIISQLEAFNYIQNLSSSVPLYVQPNSSKNCKIVFKNIGPLPVADLYAKILIDSPFVTSIDSVYIGLLSPGQIDSISFNIISPAMKISGELIIRNDTINILDGLVGWYPFKGNAIDSSGFGNDGTVYGATLSTDRFGKENSAFNFNGADYIQVPHSESLNFGTNNTFSFWIKASPPLALQKEYYFFAKHNPNDGITGISGIHGGIHTFGESYPNVFFRYDRSSWGNPWGGGSVPNMPAFDTWTHLVLVIGENADSIYINGVLSYSEPKASTTIIGSNTWPMYFGKDVAGWSLSTDAGFKGQMDDIRIYNRVLSSAEINALYHEGGY